MAREAIEKVRNAEDEALEIVAKAEHDALELLAKAGEDAQTGLKAFQTGEKLKTRESLDKAKLEAEKEFDDFKKEVSEKCKKRREEILAGSEDIIGRIIDAVKKG